MLCLWDAIEADFLRDYQIDLVEQLDGMSWRRFLVLLHNLSPEGAVAARIRAEQDTEIEEDQKTDEQAANAFFASVMSI